MSDAKKTLSITIHGSKLEYDFGGNWTGKDVRVAMAHLPRQYKLAQRQIRRDGLKILKEMEPPKKFGDKEFKDAFKKTMEVKK